MSQLTDTCRWAFSKRYRRTSCVLAHETNIDCYTGNSASEQFAAFNSIVILEDKTHKLLLPECKNTWTLYKHGYKTGEQRSTRPKALPQVICTLRRSDCPHVYLNNIEIARANVAKYLGLHLDSKMTWKVHITKKKGRRWIKQLNKYTGFLGKIIPFLRKQVTPL